MPKNLFVLFGLLGALATGALAQDLNFQDQTSFKFRDELIRPRRVDDKSSGVKAVVVVNTAVAEQVAFDMLNQKRADNGLKPLSWSDELATIARLHSHNMAELKFFGHRGLDNKMVSDRADDIGLKKWRAIGENIAYNRGYQDPIGRAVELWLDSPSHRQNLMNSDWRETALGVAVAEDGSYYLTQVFMRR